MGIYAAETSSLVHPNFFNINIIVIMAFRNFFLRRWSSAQ